MSSLPSEAGSFIGGGIAVVFGIIWMGFAAGMGAPFPFPLFGLVFIGFAIFGMINGATKASGYRDAENAFNQQRNDLIRRIGEARRD